MWQSILRYLGVEIVKQLFQMAQDWVAKKAEEKKKKEREANRAKRDKLLLALEVARQNGDIAAVDRISSDLLKLSND